MEHPTVTKLRQEGMPEDRIISSCDQCNQPIFEGEEYLQFDDGDIHLTVHKKCQKDFAFDYVRINGLWNDMKYDFDLDKQCAEYLENCFTEVGK